MRISQQTIGTHALPVMRPVIVHNPRIGLGHTAYHHVGNAPVGGIADSAWSLAGTAAMGLAAYHGYKRTGSIGWTLLWAICGGIAPIITTGVVLAQGVGKKG